MNNPLVVAVTKTHPYDIVKKAMEMGYTHIGENRVEEAEQKILQAKKDGIFPIWHMIGHVQSRKVKDVVKLFDRVDSVDSIELLEKLDSAARKMNKVLPVLLEINISKESTKYGFHVIPAILNYPNLIIEGLMTMAPFVTNPEDNRHIFRSLRALSDSTPNIGRVLSMGTSCDYIVAIEEGATEVRLGEVLFGKRMI